MLCRALLLAGVLATGCATPRKTSSVSYYRGKCLKPVVAVTEFENRANASGRWNLGSGMADLLITELIKSDRVVVLERKDLKHILDEIALQGREWFRREGKVVKGRLHNARYLIQGSVTDFTESSEVGGWLVSRWLRLFGRSKRARVAIVLRVSDVETGEILASVKAEHSVAASGFGGAAEYKDIAFGGDAFFRTPLGRATEVAIRKAVRGILKALPTIEWQAQIAAVSGNVAIVNGGRNMGIRPGQVFEIRGAPVDVTDPSTGQVIERISGPVKGHLKISRVLDRSAHAEILGGKAERGDFLVPVQQPVRAR